MTVRFLDLARLHDSIRPELDSAFRRAVADSSFVGGPAVGSFERAFAEAHGGGTAAACGSGTDALALALRALGIGSGDEVVVPAMTFVATAEAVVHVGATPVLADVDPETLLITPGTVAAVRTERTRAVIPVHLYGHVVPFDAIATWRRAGLVVVEDAAQAHLATWEGRMVGSEGHAACFSFYPGKNLGALGDGGLVLSNDDALTTEVRLLRDHGRTTKYEHSVVGWCSRLDALQAALLAAKLPYLPAWTEARRARAAHYGSLLPPGWLVPWDHGAVHHLLVVRVPAAAREPVRQGLAGIGIETGIHYPVALSRQPSLEPWSTPCPAAEAAATEVFSLPLDPLMTDAEVEEVCEGLLVGIK